jgi:hypothetical protein
MRGISSIEELVKVLKEEVVPTFGRSWWRGQPAGKELLPKAYRAGTTHRMEWLRAMQFKQKATPRHPRLPGQEQFDEWLFLMQHHGLPTRLLDWTESPLIACHFAVREENDADGCLWALSPDYLNVCYHGAGDPIHPSLLMHYFEAPFIEEDSNPPPLDKIVAVLTTEIDFRMLQQQSVFTIHGTRTPIEKLPDSPYFLKSFEIPSAAKKDLRKELLWLGVRDANLFPDLDHLATDLSRTVQSTS